jgi:hypothetical protein
VKKRYLFLIVVVILTFSAVYLYSLRTQAGAVEGRIKSIGSSVCTLDYPSSHCSEAEVVIRGDSGREYRYVMPGWSAHEDRDKAEAVREKLYEARDNDQTVRIETDERGLIVSVE